MALSDIVNQKYVDFDVIKEPWSFYKIIDSEEVGLRAKLILERVILGQSSTDPKKGAASPSFRTVFTTFPPFSLKGPSENPPPLDKIPNSKKTPLNFRVDNQQENLYLLKNGMILKARIGVKKIYRTPHYSQAGDPWYGINHDITFEITLVGTGGADPSKLGAKRTKSDISGKRRKAGKRRK